ncbi:MAG: TIGR00269 family protein [archaeon]
MKCFLCGRKAIEFLPYLGKAVCDRCFIRIYERRVSRVIHNHKMFDKNEKICLGVSGGKDSLSLLYFLRKRKYDVYPVLIDEGIKGYRDITIKYAEKACKKLGLDLKIYRFKDLFGFNLDDVDQKLKCSVCGVLRRRALNTAARELGCTKIATAHNLDDEAQTALMNFARGEIWRLARSGPISGYEMHPKFIPRVKPLRECLERENVIYALLNGIEFKDIDCPYAREALRNEYRNAINLIEEKHPGTKFGILRTSDKLSEILRKIQKQKFVECEMCGEIGADKICKVCKILSSLQGKVDLKKSLG